MKSASINPVAYNPFGWGHTSYKGDPDGVFSSLGIPGMAFSFSDNQSKIL